MARRRRRPRWRRVVGRGVTTVALPAAAVALVVGLVVGGVAQMGRASGSYRATLNLGYGTLTASAVRQSNTSGSALRTVLAGVGTMDRVSLFAALDGLDSDVRHERALIDGFIPPAPAADTTPCRTAFSLRVDAVSSVRDALESLMGGPTGGAPADASATVSNLVASGTTLVRADTSWASCRHQFRVSRGRPRLLVSRWISGSSPLSPYAVGRLVDTVVHTPRLEARHALSVAALTTVPPVLAAGNGSVIAPTTRLTVHAVVADTGNVDQPAVQVQATLSPAGGQGAPATETAIVAVGAGRAVAVVLGPFTVQPGGAYTLSVTAAPPQGPGATSASTPLQVETVPTTTTTTTSPASATTTTTPARHPGTTVKAGG